MLLETVVSSQLYRSYPIRSYTFCNKQDQSVTARLILSSEHVVLDDHVSVCMTQPFKYMFREFIFFVLLKR